MSFVIPKITYPAASPTSTLNMTYPPVSKPGVSYEGDDLSVSGIGTASSSPSRIDSIALDGHRQSMYIRTDRFKNVQLESVPRWDMTAWTAFMQYAIQGGSFLYYPDATLTEYEEWWLEDTDFNPKVNVRGLNKFAMVLRNVPGGLHHS